MRTTINYRDGGRLENKTLSLDEFPMVCIGFRWPAPGLLRGNAPSNAFEGESVTRFPEGEMQHLLKDGEALKIARVSPLDFARMLAKIAHSYMVAEYGEGSFHPLLNDFIRGKTDVAPYWVGGDASGVPLEDQPTVLHDIYRQDCVTNGTEYALIAIRLFAFMGMPRYHVVVGQTRQ